MPSPPSPSTDLIETTTNMSQLLPELLAECFIHIRDLYFDTDSPYSWLYIMQVCKYWHDTAVTCPHLWCFIDIGICNLNTVQLFIQRSGSVPLTILYPRHNRDNIADNEAKLAVILNQAHRLRYLDVHIPESLIPKLMSHYPNNLNMPVLRKLRIRNGIPDRSISSDTTVSFPFELPILTSLQLEHFGYRHIATLFQPRLRSLILSPYGYPPMETVLDHLHGMPDLEVLEFCGLPSLSSVFNDGDGRKLRLEQLKSLTISGAVTDMAELMTRIVVPPQGLSLSLHFFAPSITLEEEKILTILDMVPDLLRCGVKSIQYPNTRPGGTVRSVYINLLTTHSCQIWGWSSVLSHTARPVYTFDDESETDDVIYRLSLMDRDPQPQVDSFWLISHNLDFSQTRTLILTLHYEQWERSHAAFKAVFDDLNNTVETIIVYLWEMEILALFLSTGDCRNATVPLGDDEPLPAAIPFPNLRTLSVYNAKHYEQTNEPKLPLTNALKYRAKHGYGIKHLCVAGYNTQDARRDLAEAGRVVPVVTEITLSRPI